MQQQYYALPPNISSIVAEFTSLHKTSRSFLRDNFKALFRGAAVQFETVPFSERRHAVLPLPDDIRRAVRKPHSVLPSSHPHVVRVRRIARRIGIGLRRLLWVRDRKTPTAAAVKHLDRLLDCPEEVVSVIDSDSINAKCLDDGSVLVCSGLLDHFAADDDAAVAFAICHEFGHAIARHVDEGIGRIVLGLLFVEAYDCVPFRKMVEEEVSRQWRPIISKGDKEFEADYIGLLLFASSGYYPRDASRILLEVGNSSGDGFLLCRVIVLSRPRVMDEALALYEEAVALSAAEKVLKSCIWPDQPTD